MNNLKMQKIAEKKRIAEANARRKVAKRWAKIGNGTGYKHAAARQSAKETATKIESEVFDGILLSLSPRNSKRSQSQQRRLLRRIVEKRQAQAAFRRIGRSEDLFAPRLMDECSCHCMHELHRYQNCI